MTTSVWQEVRREILPFPGRLEGTVTLTGLVLLTTALCMAFRVPEAALSCYMLFFAFRDNRGDAIFTALKLVLAATVAILIALPIMNAVIDAPMARLVAIAGFTFAGMFLSQASKAGPLGGTAGFVFAFALTLADVIPVPELLSRAVEWMWVVIALPMGLMAAVMAVVGPSPRALAEAKIEARRAALSAPRSGRAKVLLDEGMEAVDGYLRFARLLGEARGAEAERLGREADDSYFRLALGEAGVAQRPSEALVQGPAGPDKVPFFKPDAFSNPRYTRFALKVLIAVLLTYGFYTAFGMFEIHTAMITCFYISLGTMGETTHKMGLRLVGALIGAVAGFAVVGVLMPVMSDVGHLLIVLAPVTFLAAWLGLGSEKISYAGWQIALCFFLVTLNSFSPQTDISAATSRVVGILIGSGAVWLVFSSLWPETAATEAATELEALQGALPHTAPPQTGREVARLRGPLVEATRLLEMARFEGRQKDETARAEALLGQVRSQYLDKIRKGGNAV